MEIRIRQAQTGDVAAIVDVVKSIDFLSAIYPDESIETTRSRVLSQLSLCKADGSHLILVAESSSGEIAGYISAHWLPYLIFAGPEGYVSELFVKERLRGRGVGTRLLEAIKTEAEKRGCSRLMLLNMRNRPSYQRQFYSKHGWQERPDVANFVLPLKPANR